MSESMYYQGHVFRVFDMPRKAGGHKIRVYEPERGLPECVCVEFESLEESSHC